MSFASMPALRSAAMTTAISLALLSIASAAVLPRVLTPPRNWAKSGATLTLPSPPTTTRASGGDGGCAACARAGTIDQTAASATAPRDNERDAAMTGSLLSNVVLAHCGQDLAQKDLARKVLARKVLARKVLARNSAI